MNTRPAEGGSSPATMLRTVDLPQPLGPRSVRNSRSAISRSSCLTTIVSPKRFSSPWSLTFATQLPLHRAGGHALDDAPLEQKDEEEHRARSDEGAGGDLPPRHLVKTREKGDADGNRLGGLRAREGEGKQELVPREDERQDRSRGDGGSTDGKGDVKERLKGRRAVDPRGPLEVRGQAPEERGEDPHREGKDEDGVGENEAPPRVPQSEAPDGEVEGTYEGHRRDHRDA